VSQILLALRLISALYHIHVLARQSAIGDQPATVKTLYNDAGRTADRIIILMVLLIIESRVGLISRKRRPTLP